MSTEKWREEPGPPKKWRVKLEITYVVDVQVTAEDEDLAEIEVKKYLAKCDDYDIVNRSDDRLFNIEKIAREWPKRD